MSDLLDDLRSLARCEKLIALEAWEAAAKLPDGAERRNLKITANVSKKRVELIERYLLGQTVEVAND